MKVKKWLLALAAFAVMAVVCAVAAGAESYGYFEYSISEDGTVEIIGYNGSAANVNIPAKINGKPVKYISENSFYNTTTLKSVNIPNSVTYIGHNAFKGCTSLSTVNIPGSVTYVGIAAFKNTSIVNKQTSPVKYVGSWVVESDKSVKNVTLKAGTTGIASSTFADCSSLIKVVLPTGIKYIGWYAFSGCNSLASINIPEGVTEIPYETFCNCTSLKSVSLPKTLKTIDNRAFMNCKSLAKITIPDNVTDIGGGAFENTAIVKNQKTAVKYVDKWIVDCDSNTKSVTVKSDTVGIGGCAFDSCIIESIELPNSIANIGMDAFYFCTELKKIVIPNNVKKIREATFMNCYSLKTITMPDSVSVIEPGAFACCYKLESIVLSNNLKEIGYSVFSGCNSLKNITVKDNKNFCSVGGVLYNKNKTKLICYPEGKTDKTFNIPNSVTTIDSSAFDGNDYLTDVKISSNVTEIADDTFNNCRSLTNITISNSVTVIGNRAFANCESLKSVAIPDSVTLIGENAFNGCKSIKSVKMPDKVTKIEREAFNNCELLKAITIPSTVKSIGYCAFGYTGIYEKEKVNGFKITCYKDTAGEKYAKDNGFDYELLEIPTLAKVTGAKLGGRAADALRINWSKNASADGYIVEMYQGNKWVRVAKITSNNTTTFRKAGLKASSVYKFRVRAYKMSGSTALYGNYSATVAARTNPSVVNGAKLGGRAADAIRINWTKNTSADGYIVEMYQGSKWVRVAKITSNSTTTFRKAGLKASTVYKFRVRAYKMSGKTALYGNYSATVTARTNPSIMKGVKIGGKAKNALRVNWTKNASAQGYIVEMYKGGKWVRVAKITNNSTTTFRKAGLAKNTAYKFRVRAYHMSGKTALYGNYGSVSGKTAAK